MTLPCSKDILTLLISNIEPDPSVIPDILTAIKRLDNDLSRPYHTIRYRTKAKQEEILRERANMLEMRRKYASIISPVRRLSEAIWARIIGFNAHDERELSTYMLVSYNWNIVASYFAYNWNNINIHLFDDECCGRVQIRDLSLVAHQLERTRPLPMDVSIDYDFEGGIFYRKSSRILADLPNKKYWRSLETGPSAMDILMCRTRKPDFPRLEEVTIRSNKGSKEMLLCNMSLRGLPLLTRLAIAVEDRIHKGDISGIDVNWCQLTYLELNGLQSEASDYLNILAASLALEVCILHLSTCPTPKRLLPVPRGSRLSMPVLREFTLIAKDCPVPFLDYVSAPRLHKLGVSWVENKPSFECTPGYRIFRFIRASQCRPRSFSLKARDILFSDLGWALRSMDSVEEVTLHISNSKTMPIVDMCLHEEGQARDANNEYASRPFLPALQAMTIHAVHLSLPLTWFIMYAQPKALFLESPQRDNLYTEDNLHSCIYEDGSLLVISGYDHLTKGKILDCITKEDPNIEVSLS